MVSSVPRVASISIKSFFFCAAVLAGHKTKTAAEVAVEIVTDAPKVSGLKVLCDAGRAKVIVREDTTKNGAWAWARLRERFGRDTGATIFTEVFQYSWQKERSRSKTCGATGSRRSRSFHKHKQSSNRRSADCQRHGQPELENHLRLRAPMAWQVVDTQGRKISLHNRSSTVTTAKGHRRCVDRCKVPELWKPVLVQR